MRWKGETINASSSYRVYNFFCRRCSLMEIRLIVRNFVWQKWVNELCLRSVLLVSPFNHTFRFNLIEPQLRYMVRRYGKTNLRVRNVYQQNSNLKWKKSTLSKMVFLVRLVHWSLLFMILISRNSNFQFFPVISSLIREMNKSYLGVQWWENDSKYSPWLL